MNVGKVTIVERGDWECHVQVNNDEVPGIRSGGKVALGSRVAGAMKESPCKE